MKKTTIKKAAKAAPKKTVAKKKAAQKPLGKLSLPPPQQVQLVYINDCDCFARKFPRDNDAIRVIKDELKDGGVIREPVILVQYIKPNEDGEKYELIDGLHRIGALIDMTNKPSQAMIAARVFPASMRDIAVQLAASSNLARRHLSVAARCQIAEEMTGHIKDRAAAAGVSARALKYYRAAHGATKQAHVVAGQKGGAATAAKPKPAPKPAATAGGQKPAPYKAPPPKEQCARDLEEFVSGAVKFAASVNFFYNNCDERELVNTLRDKDCPTVTKDIREQYSRRLATKDLRKRLAVIAPQINRLCDWLESGDDKTIKAMDKAAQ